jgi:ABC-2 type transport system permease protein
MSVKPREHARILRWAFVSALADLRAVYTWRAWTFGWLVRNLCQVAFFALIGKLVGSPDVVGFLIIGNAVFLVAQAVLLTISTTVWERMTGTLPLLIASPAPLFTVFAGRSVEWILDGGGCAIISLFGLAPLFGVRVPMPDALLAIPLVALIALSMYAFSLALGGLALRVMHLRVVILNLSIFALMLFTGVQVPRSFWPPAVRYPTDLLPLTHGLAAIRALYNRADAVQVATQAGLEAAVGLSWLLLAWIIIRHFVNQGRKTGAIEFDE